MPSETLTRGNVVYEKTVCLGNCNEYCYLMSQCLFFLSFLTKLREYSSKQPSFVGSYWMGFPGGSAGRESSRNAGDLGSIRGLERYPGEGNGHTLLYSCLENSRDRRAWWATVHGVAKIPWRREWLPTPVFLPGEYHGQKSLVGYSSWGHKESKKI